MVKDISGSTQHLDRQCSIVYEYLHHRAATQSPVKVIQEFQNLFQQGKNQNVRVSQALGEIILAPEQFDEFLSNCFYTILNCWLDTESRLQIEKLLDVLDLISSHKSLDRRRKKLLRLIENYRESSSYLRLRAIIAIVKPQTSSEYHLKSSLMNDSVSNNNGIEINSCLVRYPYLYKRLLPQSDRFHSLELAIEQLAKDRQTEFEFLLSKYIIYRFRLKQLAKMKLLSRTRKIITKVDSPSLLSQKDFKIALRQYIGKTDNQTVVQRSRSFIAENKERNSYRVFKQDLHLFLTDNLTPKNNAYQFSNRLQHKLNEILPQSDAKPLNSSLILQTCRHLFSFLIVDFSLSNPNRLKELITNLGTARVMLILVKITSICPQSKPDLERKICFLVTHYQQENVQNVVWLIKSLEHLLIAFSIYFGKIDVPIVSDKQ